jgi:hypothetical protein
MDLPLAAPGERVSLHETRSIVSPPFPHYAPISLGRIASYPTPSDRASYGARRCAFAAEVSTSRGRRPRAHGVPRLGQAGFLSGSRTGHFSKILTPQITDITAKSEQFASYFDMSMIQVKRFCRNFGQSRPRQPCRILEEGRPRRWQRTYNRTSETGRWRQT